MFYPLVIRDIIEIAFCSLIMYTFCLWLKTDKTKNILIYFLGYCMLMLVSWTVQLPTLTSFLFSYAPIAVMLFILLHEKTLQRNFVTLRNPAQEINSHDDWLDNLLSSSLSVVNANKCITVIIENHDSLTPFLTTPFFIKADMGKGILDILLSSSTYNEQKMIWVDAQGHIRGINVSWIDRENKDNQDALFYTSQTDALIFSISPLNHACTFIAHGKEFPSLSAHHLRMLIKKQIASTSQKKNKGVRREGSTAPENSLSL